MATTTYPADRTALLIVDPYNVRAWRFNMAKNIEHKKAKDEETLSDQRDLVDHSLSRSGCKS